MVEIQQKVINNDQKVQKTYYIYIYIMYVYYVYTVYSLFRVCSPMIVVRGPVSELLADGANA